MKGYLLYAQGDTHINYAIQCAYSLREIGDTKPISLVTDKPCNDTIFDKIIIVKENTDKFHVVNRSNLWKHSPYDETTVIESDCLVTQSLDTWWQANADRDLSFISQAYTYRQEPLDIRFDRRTWIQNDLPSLYVAFHYFKKTSFVKEFFELVTTINLHEEITKTFLPKRSPKVPSMDVAICLATKFLDCYYKVAYTASDPMFIHMKPNAQKFATPSTNWSDKVGFYKNGSEVFIGNFKQTGILHYIEEVV